VIAKGIAEGDVDPSTLEPIEDINPSFNPAKKRTLNMQLREPLQQSLQINTSQTPRSEPQKMIMDFFSKFCLLGRHEMSELALKPRNLRALETLPEKLP
jgi:hypothetical protein